MIPFRGKARKRGAPFSNFRKGPIFFVLFLHYLAFHTRVDMWNQHVVFVSIEKRAHKENKWCEYLMCQRMAVNWIGFSMCRLVYLVVLLMAGLMKGGCLSTVVASFVYIGQTNEVWNAWDEGMDESSRNANCKKRLKRTRNIRENSSSLPLPHRHFLVKLP